MSPEPPFSEDDVLAGIDFAERDERRYEGEIVTHLLSRYGIGPGVKERLRHYRGTNQLTLEAFHEEFPTFPITLAARRWRKIREKNRLSDLFGNFYDRNFYKAWHEERDKVSGGVDGDFGLVFHWPYLKGRFEPTGGGKRRREPGGSVGLVLRDGSPNSAVPGTRVLVVGAGGAQFTLEPFSVLLREIDENCGGEWNPND